MNKGLKITLITLGSLALAGGIGFGIYRLVQKRKREREEVERELQEIQDLEEINEGLEGQQETQGDKISPARNLDKSINNPFNKIKGTMIYPAIKSNNPIEGHPYASGYANIRSSAEVNDSQGWQDLWQDNIIGKIPSGIAIGTIIGEQYDDMTPKMRWFKVKLSKKLEGEKYGWVRADVVTFKPFTKKTTNKTSSFQGSFIQKYDNSYQLGASVFPHSNWMIGYPAYGNDVMSDFEGKIDLDI